MSAPAIDPKAHDKYLLEVTAGPSYSASEHVQVNVNSDEATPVSSDLLDAWIKVRIKAYHGLPKGSPSTSSYFEHPLHASDRYSVSFSFVPKRDISGNDLIMGFDYGHSIKHQLPPGFNYAMKIVTTILDRGIYADAYCDEPYLYGAALSSFFALHIGELTSKIPAAEQISSIGSVIEEGASGSGQEIRDSQSIPDRWKKRRKHFLSTAALKNFTFEKGRMYHADFFNPHLDFAEFALRLPGFSIGIAKYIDEKTHHLRFVLRDREKGESGFVVIFRLLFGEELEERLRQEESKSGKGANETGIEKKMQQVSLEQPTGVKPEEIPQKAAPKLDEHNTPVSRDGNHSDTSSQTTLTEGTASAVSSLTGSIYAVYSALGFAKGYSSSEAEPSGDERSRERSRDPSTRSVEAKIDDMKDAEVEQYLQSKNSSLK